MAESYKTDKEHDRVTFHPKRNYVLLKENAIRKLSLFYFPLMAPLTAFKHKKQLLHKTLYTYGHITVMRIWGIILLNCHKNYHTMKKKTFRLYFINAKSNF